MLKYMRFMAWILMVLLPFQALFAAHTSMKTCHPNVNSRLPQYIVGYGSFMSETSKRETETNIDANIPVLVSGFQRGWIVASQHPGFTLVYLGVKINPAAKFNGVVFKMRNKNLEKYDTREVGYCRVEVKRNTLKTFSADKLPAGQYWIYVGSEKNKNTPSSKNPIVQSYVDIFLSGCFELQEKYQLKNFAKSCVNTTTNWSPHWVNDRIYPRRAYGRPMITKIDNLLAKEIPHYFQAIKIE